MNRSLRSAIAFSLATFAATTALGQSNATNAPGSPITGGVVRDIPLVDWPAPQTFGGHVGVTSTLPGLATAREKATLNVATFISVTPCRLVDTRGKFNPVYAGGPFAAGEVRVYRAAGNCGVPAGANRLMGVSIAVTTPPTPLSGDIEVIANGVVLGKTVLMVVQAGQWNSATEVTSVDANGDFQVQLRTTTGDVALDVNGYYASTNTANASDFFQVDGRFDSTSGGGVFSSHNSSTTGAGVHANNGANSDVSLASGTSAIDVAQGGFRVRGAGVGTPTMAFQHQVDTSNVFGTGSGTLCGLTAGFNNTTILSNPYTDNNPAAILMVIPTAGTGTSYGSTNPGHSYWVYYQPSCTGNVGAGHWSITTTGGAPIENGLAFNVLVFYP